jgi:hypothetical protein
MGIETGTALLISSLASGGAGIASGLSAKKRTQTTDTTPKLDPSLQPLQNDLLARIQSRLGSGGVDLSAVKSPAVEAVNRRYRNLPASITAGFSGRGYGSSGVLQSAQAAAQRNRIGDLNDLEGKFAGFQLDENARIENLAAQVLAAGRGSSTVSTGSGNALGAGISSGLETLTTLMAMRRMLGENSMTDDNGFRR